MAVEMPIPDYHNQRRLPANSTISLWEDRAVLYNEDNVESQVILPPNYKDSPWCDVLDNISTYWFAAVTKVEYTMMLNEDNETDKLPGSLRKPGNWEQFIMLPTTEESMGHTMTNDQTIVLAISFDLHSMAHHMAGKKLSSFQRGHSAQVHAPRNCRFTEAEKNNVRALHLNYNAANEFDRYNWSNGWI